MKIPLTDREKKTLIVQCQLLIEDRYTNKLDGDEYFKRGFLLACKEMADEMVKSLDNCIVYPSIVENVLNAFRNINEK
jgi:HEPN domain-containing protein